MTKSQTSAPLMATSNDCRHKMKKKLVEVSTIAVSGIKNLPQETGTTVDRYKDRKALGHQKIEVTSPQLRKDTEAKASNKVQLTPDIIHQPDRTIEI